MAKAKTTGSERGRASKHLHEYHCGGGCAGYDGQLCPECADWGDMLRRRTVRRVEADTETTP